MTPRHWSCGVKRAEKTYIAWTPFKLVCASPGFSVRDSGVTLVGYTLTIQGKPRGLPGSATEATHCQMERAVCKHPTTPVAEILIGAVASVALRQQSY
jgi:hypothetical protein